MRSFLLLLGTVTLALPTLSAADPAPPASADSAASSALATKLDKLITFEPGRRRIYSKGREELRKVARLAQATCPDAQITVEGNAYFANDEEASIALGQARADLVRQLLVRYGMAPDAVIAIGYARDTLENGNGRYVDLVIDCPRR